MAAWASRAAAARHSGPVGRGREAASSAPYRGWLGGVGEGAGVGGKEEGTRGGEGDGGDSKRATQMAFPKNDGRREDSTRRRSTTWERAWRPPRRGWMDVKKF